jgi:polyisoprenoid-binding protein YceI
MRRKWWIALVAVVAVLVVAGGAVWYFVFRDNAPAEVSLDRASRSLDDPKQSGPSATTGSGRAGVDGTWTVNQSIGSFSDFTSSFAGFRVQEELVGIGGKTAVGRTPNVTGSITIDGTTVPKANFDVDMASIVTDDERRTNALRTQGIETARFPKATFTLTQPIPLGRVPADGEKMSVNATGDLTLHGVTKQVTIPLEAQRSGDTIAVVGQLPIAFADYSISQPRAATVLSVDDNGLMEVQLFFTRAAT